MQKPSGSVYGRICPKHPELNGLRRARNNECRGCRKDAAVRWRKNRMGTDPEYRGKWLDKYRNYAKKRRKVDEEYRERYINSSRATKRKLRTRRLGNSWNTEIRAIYAEARKVGRHVDHIIPINGENVSGLHVPWNLQIMEPAENIKKSNKVIHNT